MLGCVNLEECQTLIDISSIDYYISSLRSKYYIGRSDKINKKLIDSVNVTISNNSTSKQEFETPFKQWSEMQNFQMNISKTGYISSNNVAIPIAFTANYHSVFIFYKNDTESIDVNDPFMVNALPQKITLEPMTQINVTYNRYSFEEFNYFNITFAIGTMSIIRHPHLDDVNNVIFSTTPLNTFLSTRLTFANNMKYKNPTVITLHAIDNTTFLLHNFPATERIINYGIELVYGEPTCIYPPPEPL